MDRKALASRIDQLTADVALTKRALDRSLNNAKQVSTWNGYVALLQGRALGGVSLQPTEQGWRKEQADSQDRVQRDEDDFEGKQQALRVFEWYAKQPAEQSGLMERALAALEEQLGEERAFEERAITKLKHLVHEQGQPTDAPDVVATREQLNWHAMRIRRYKIAIKSARGEI